MACEYIVAHPKIFDGLVLLASYPAESTNLSAIDLCTVLIYGTQDGVSSDVFKASVNRLSLDTVLVEIAGGNHAQFGDYGPQKGDGTATIAREQQQRLTAEAILSVLYQLEPSLAARDACVDARAENTDVESVVFDWQSQ